MEKIAILYQANLPPIKDGIKKPMKPGGYSDSGADIAYELVKNGISLIIPVNIPKVINDLDWVFPDTMEGIQNALNKGANIFWLNTILYKNHPIEHFFEFDIEIIGQIPVKVDIYDDKWTTNKLLEENKIPIPKANLITKEQKNNYTLNFDFPMVVKPIKGRGSQGVTVVKNQNELNIILANYFLHEEFGTSLYVEQFLKGQEITVTVMPSGIYNIKGNLKEYKKPWCLPAVKRFNHQNGIAPYNGVVAVVENSKVLEKDEQETKAIQDVYKYCEEAARLINIKAPIRIDCRADKNGTYYLFDLNMKPNMTGPSRPNRKNQDSLSSLAGRAIGWTYFDLLKNMIEQKWKPVANIV